ncbi:MAG: VTT domain-containing protein [Chloroflexota bacterium]
MDGLIEIVKTLLRPEHFLQELGPYAYAVLFAIIFSETALFIGFFLPGDSLLLTAGLVASHGYLDIWVLVPLLMVAAVIGDATGYWIGRRAGPRLFAREDSRLFRRRHLLQAKEFYDRHGGKTIFLARYLAFVRAFAPTIAGAVGMPWGKFSLYNVVGGISWVLSMVLLGYFVGTALPNLDAIFLGITAFIVALSLAPAVYHLWRERRRATVE